MRQRTRVLTTLAALGSLAIITTGAASSSAARRLNVSYHRVKLLGAGHIRVVQLTDLHLGRFTSRRLVREAQQAVRAAKPDLVVLTGDYLNHSLRHLPDLDRFLAELPCPCVATLGNHDYWSGAEAIRSTLERHRVHVLRNSHYDLRVGEQTLTIVGVDDGRTKHADSDRAFTGVTNPGRALVLTHFPTTAKAIVARGGRLVLAGHTHGGQFGVPVLAPALARLFGTRYLAGWHRVGPARLYVSPGIGSAFLFRMGKLAAPEIAVLDLI
jgi:uncharacterized protein